MSARQADEPARCHRGAAPARVPSTRGPAHLCMYEAQAQPCNPCRWWNVGTCNKARCKFCHIPSELRPMRAPGTAEEQHTILQDLLPNDKLEGYIYYDALVRRKFRGPCREVLRQLLRSAYMESFSIASTKPYGAAGEFTPGIHRIKCIVDEIEEFIDSLTVRGGSRGGLYRSRKQLCRLWQREAGRRLHAVLCEKIFASESREDIVAWLAVTKEMASCMGCLGAAARGGGDDGQEEEEEEDEDLDALQEELRHMAMHSATAIECHASLRQDFGDA